MVKKAKKSAKQAATAKKPKPARKSSPKPKKMTKLERDVSARLISLGKTLEANEAVLEINLEIDRTFGGGSRPRFGEVAGRMSLALRAFQSAVLVSDDFDSWVADARKAAGLV